jgi:PQQ-like domain
MRAFGVVAFLLILTPACALRAAVVAQTSPNPAPGAPGSQTPPPWSGPAQVTPPLPVVRDAPVPVLETHAARTDSVLPASLAGAKLVAEGGHNLYFSSAGDSVVAVDARTGVVRWRAEGVQGYSAAASGTLLFVNSVPKPGTLVGSAIALAAEDGRRTIVRPGYWSGSVLHGFFYASRDNPGEAPAFTAYDAATGRELWSNRGAASVGGPPALIGSTLLQSFSESGAILVNAMHAFDVVTGRELWRAGYGPRPLGTGPGVVYLDTTWFPLQLDSYAPLAVGTADLATGAMRHEFYYKPDLARNWPRRPNTPYGARGAHAGGGFVTFEVNGAWYRYDADRDPNTAHAVRLDGIDDVAAWVGETRALVTANGATALGRWLPDRIVLQPLGSGALRAPVAVSDGGTRYAVIGARSFAIDAGSVRVRALGAVPCEHVDEVIPLSDGVAVRCPAERTGDRERLITFADPAAPAASALPHPRPTAPPHFTLSVRQWPVPPAATAPGDRQWWPSSIAAGPGGALAIVLTPGGMVNRAGAIGRVAPNGVVRLVRLPASEPPASPHDAVVDAHGTISFNDQRASTVTSLRADGTLRALQIGATPAPSPTPRVVVMGGRAMRIFPGPRSLGIRLALGPDGEAWYARTHPTRAIGRVDGTRTLAVPDAIGDIVALAGGHDGALWFLTDDAAGRVTLDGTFSRVALPETFPRGSYPPRRLVAGRTNTVWVANGKQVAEIDARRVLRTWSLPNASSAIAALTAGCDGTLYVADALGTQLARFAPDGSVEEHDTGLSSIDGLATASDCRLWFVGGSNAPDQQVGTFAFTPVTAR